MPDSKHKKLADLISPDERPADGGLFYEDQLSHITLVMKVRGLGALVFRGSIEQEWHGIASFTDEEIQFD